MLSPGTAGIPPTPVQYTRAPGKNIRGDAQHRPDTPSAGVTLINECIVCLIAHIKCT